VVLSGPLFLTLVDPLIVTIVVAVGAAGRSLVRRSRRGMP
jgi:hypothetical protein